MFESKAELEYNLKYLNDVRKNFKSAASATEKASNQAENAFIIKSLLFETASYFSLLDKFSEQYIEGMDKLKKAKEYNDKTYDLAMNSFKNAHDIISYANTQHGIILYLQDLVTQENLKNVSEEDAANISKKLTKLEESLSKISDDVNQLREILKSINDQTVYEEGDFKFLETGMLSCIKKETDTVGEIPSMIKNIARTILNSSDLPSKSRDRDYDKAPRETDSGYYGED